ncbi:uncharacterized protein BDR25DRAFT_375085 [Lindgomyces ingoldianus]|uniref:Uncharacterized protein n=1 Tax=Lindgomyces ingoldianus TaxID=673940 RepID=A0ACB6RAP8_9PLEO|nr:uncharacterized protein BDR25DRAFT_375085 [Lindgomyces ingoldianus]KAF2476251.1 hypothetical protein BDR25DRAFT_375085 [Lindgomyces ingoldianus]
MKFLIYFLPLLSGLALAAEEKCQCPLVKCPSEDAVALCQCLNSRETICKNHCPDYVPTYIPTPTPGCECEHVYCPMVWPESCKCENADKKRCYDKCGGVAPTYQVSPPSLAETRQVLTRPQVCEDIAPRMLTITRRPKPTKTKTMTPATPTASHAVCGGGRANYLTCPEGEICIKDPFKPGCGPECDGLGICVKDKLCGGFAAFRCPEGQTCMDDPRDTCDPMNGGADCGGLCI